MDSIVPANNMENILLNESFKNLKVVKDVTFFSNNEESSKRKTYFKIPKIPAGVGKQKNQFKSRIPRSQKLMKIEKQVALAKQLQIESDKEKYSDLVTTFEYATKKGIISLVNLIEIAKIYPDTKEAFKNIMDHITLITSISSQK